jgi:hypothetical protein
VGLPPVIAKWETLQEKHAAHVVRSRFYFILSAQISFGSPAKIKTPPERGHVYLRRRRESGVKWYFFLNQSFTLFVFTSGTKMESVRPFCAVTVSIILDNESLSDLSCFICSLAVVSL